MYKPAWTIACTKPKRGWQTRNNTYRLLGFGVLLSLSACQSQEENQRQQYITEGIRIYETNCANCHQHKGDGLAGLYPPLKNSDFLADKQAVICLIRYGHTGPMVVNGQTYRLPMPPTPHLSDMEIAELTTYIYAEWGNDSRQTSIEETKKALATCRK